MTARPLDPRAQGVQIRSTTPTSEVITTPTTADVITPTYMGAGWKRFHEFQMRKPMPSRPLTNSVAMTMSSEMPIERRRLVKMPGSDEGRTISISLRGRSEEHTSELQSLMRISYAVFCLKKKKNTNQ